MKETLKSQGPGLLAAGFIAVSLFLFGKRLESFADQEIPAGLESTLVGALTVVLAYGRPVFGAVLRRIVSWVQGGPKPPKLGALLFVLMPGAAEAEILELDHKPGEIVFDTKIVRTSTGSPDGYEARQLWLAPMVTFRVLTLNLEDREKNAITSALGVCYGLHWSPRAFDSDGELVLAGVGACVDGGIDVTGGGPDAARFTGLIVGRVWQLQAGIGLELSLALENGAPDGVAPVVAFGGAFGL